LPHVANNNLRTSLFSAIIHIDDTTNKLINNHMMSED